MAGRVSSFLVSFCNVRDNYSPLLALVTLVRGGNKIRWVQIPHRPRPKGITGLCYHGGRICVMYQTGFGYVDPAGIALLDLENAFEPGAAHSLPPDPHSVCSDGEALYFTITGRDSVYKALYDEESGGWKVWCYWTLPGSPGDKDRNHINGIGFFNGNLHVSGFEQKKATSWELATQGFIYDIDNESYVMQGINHPHSLLGDSQRIWTCESRANRLLSHLGDVYEFPSTYLRGLVMDEDHIYAGSSKKRLFSKSKSGPRTRRKYEGYCALYRARRATGEAEIVVDFSKWCNEIYDVLPLRPEQGALLT